MNAMSSASDNAKDLKKKLSTTYNRKRQAKITSKTVAPLPPCQLLRVSALTLLWWLQYRLLFKFFPRSNSFFSRVRQSVRLSRLVYLFLF